MLHKLFSDATSMFKKLQNGPFAQSTMALCAIGAMADGNLDDEEFEAAINAINDTEQLKAFGADKLAVDFENYCTQWAKGRAAKMVINKKVAELSSLDDESKNLAAMIALDIIESKGGGKVEDCEKEALTKAFQSFGVKYSKIAG